MRSTAVLVLGFLAVATGVLVAQRTGPGPAESPDVVLKTAINRELIDGDVETAVQRYRDIVTRFRTSAPAVAAKALVQMAASYDKLARPEARATYQEIVRDFANQREAVAVARARLGTGSQSPSRPEVTLKSIKRGVWIGSVSTDGKYLTSIDATGNLSVHDLRTGTDRALTQRGDYNLEASAISRDGTLVAFQSYAGCVEMPGSGLGIASPDSSALCSVSLQGDAVETPRTIFSSADVSYIAPMDWSPDGRSIAVSLKRADHVAQIGLIAVADGSLRVLQTVDWRGPTRVFFSPDGRYLAYDLAVNDASEDRSIFVLAADGSRRITAVEHGSQNIVMGWTPDGEELLFASDRSGPTTLWAQPFRDERPFGSPRLVYSSLGRARPMGLTKAGALYFRVTNSDRDVSVVTLSLSNGRITAPPTRPIQRHVGTNLMPDWSPDGKYLAYVSQRGLAANNGGLVIGIRSVSTGEVRELRPKLLYFLHISWAPDGNAFLTGGTDTKGRSGVFRIDAQTGEVSLIASATTAAYPKWSPDGKRVFYRKIAAGQRNWAIVERDLASGRERDVATGRFGTFSVSPDGKTIAAFASPATGALSTGEAVVQIHVDTGVTRSLLKAGPSESFPVYTGLPWTPDGRAVLIRKNSSKPVELWLVPITGEPARKLAVDVTSWHLGPFGVVSLSRDGRQIAYTSGSIVDEAMVLENFLPAQQETPPATLAIRRVLDQGRPHDRISPDGRFIARPDPAGNLALHELATGRVRALTSDASQDEPDHRYAMASAFSRDGSQIAYIWFFEKDLRSVLRVVSTAENGTHSPRTVYDNPDLDFAPTDWSPDGKWIAGVIRRRDHSAQIGLVGVADGSLHVLKTVDWSRVGGLRFSPDSSRLAYHRPEEPDSFERDVFVIAVDASREVVAADSPGDDSVLEWTPDGQSLLIASDRGGSMSVWSVPASGRARTATYELVKSDIGIINSLGPTRDGALYYNLLPSGSNIYLASFDLASGQLSSPPVPAIHQFKGFASGPRWSADGKYLVYSSRREVPAPINVTRQVLSILSLETGKVVRELHPALSYGGPGQWSPDGRQIIARGADLKGRDGIVKIDTTTGAASVVAPNETCSGIPFWAPDGQSFFCYRDREEQIVRVDITSGSVLRTFPAKGQGAGVSPDGRYVVFGDGYPRGLRLLTISLATGETREFLPLSPESQARFTSMAWTPDSRSVVFYGRLRGDEGMWLVPIDGRSPHKIEVAIKPIAAWQFSPKTSQVAFTTALESRLEMWKMEHFLPAARTSDR